MKSLKVLFSVQTGLINAKALNVERYQNLCLEIYLLTYLRQVNFVVNRVQAFSNCPVQSESLHYEGIL
jgi:hypothetical protein